MQKKRIKMIFPVPMSEATRPLVESQLPPGIQRPDIEVPSSERAAPSPWPTATTTWP